MNQRRVQKVGKNTLTVSLPRWWVVKHGIKPGDLLCVEEDFTGALKFWPQKTDAEQSFKGCSINADSCRQSGLLRRLIITSYVFGIDTIVVYSPTNLNYACVREIRKTIELLMGVSIIKEGRQQIVMQCLLDILNFPIYTLLKRLYELSASMYEEGIQALLDGNRELAKMVISRKEEVEKMYYLLLRALSIAQKSREISKRLGIEDPLMEIPNIRTIGYCMKIMAEWSESIARSAIKLLSCGVEFDEQSLKKFERFHELCREVSQKSVQSFFSQDLELANEMIRKYYEELEVMENDILSSISYNSIKCESKLLCPHLTCVIWGMRRQAELGAEIAGATISTSLKLRPDIIQLGIISDKEIMRLLTERTR